MGRVVFSSPTFLFAFLPLTLAVLALVRHRGFQNTWLLAMSVVFYLWGAGAAIGAILYVTLVSWSLAFVPWARLRAAAPRSGFRVAVGAAVLGILAPLLFFKYIPPLAELAGTPGLELVLPLGISFFTFHGISYLIDVVRGDVERERNVRDYALYLFVFPHQIAGPIVRYAEIREALHRHRDAPLRQVGYGFTRFSWGLAKKALVADPSGRLADQIFAANASSGDVSAPDAWIGAALYALQIYFDFSAYSDMAIGLAAIMGFRFPENFDQPYRSISVTDFWRRWHMTLSRWFRDYVYIPLGGSRHGAARSVLALLVVFTLTSLWHGAALTFLVWGGLHSAMLLIERFTGLRHTTRLAVPRRILMLLFIVLSWVPFRAETMTEAIDLWQAMLTGGGAISPAVLTGVTPALVLAVVLGCASLVGRRDRTGFATVFGARSDGDDPSFRMRLAIPAAIVLLVAAIAAILWSDFSPFLYFQF